MGRASDAGRWALGLIRVSELTGVPSLLHSGPFLSGEDVISIFVAPAEAGVQAFARSGAPFRLDPGLRRDDNSLSLAGFNARGCSRFFAPIVVSVIFSRTAVRVRKDDGARVNGA